MIIFCDFDGTITNSDLIDIIINNYYGKEKQKEFEQ